MKGQDHPTPPPGPPPHPDQLHNPGELRVLSTGVTLAGDGQNEEESCLNSGPTLSSQDAKTNVN